MANILDGEFTIHEVMNYTKAYFPNRFKNLKRDKVRMIKIKTIQYYEKDRKQAPKIKYEIISRSTPQYKPYFTKKDSRGRVKKFQTKVKHFYTTTIQLGELSIHSYQWKMALGSLSKWEPKPKQEKIKSIYRDTMKKWKKQAEKRYDSKKDQKEWLNKKINKHKKRAEFLDVGDFNASKGRNGDFYFRFAMVYKQFNHLFSRYYGKNDLPIAKHTNKEKVMAFPKHIIAILTVLLNTGILKN